MASEALFRTQLEQRRERLAAATAAGGDDVRRLLSEVDTALARLEDGSFGLCDECHETVEAARLLADPLCRFCLDHLPPVELRALERDLELAGRIQAALLPGEEPAVAGFETAARYRPAGMVSGDYYDVIPLPGPQRETLLLFGDVAGKGVSASLLMASLQALFRSLAPLGLKLTDLLARANRLFCESTPASSYATLVCARAAPSGTLELASAGHCPPLLARSGRVEAFPSTGLPLGLFCGAGFEAVTLELSPGDLVLLYTDGVSEARSAAGDEYGLARMEALLARAEGSRPERVVERLLDDIASFCGGRALADDVTVLALRRVAS